MIIFQWAQFCVFSDIFDLINIQPAKCLLWMNDKKHLNKNYWEIAELFEQSDPPKQFL